MNLQNKYVKKILSASVYQVAIETPLDLAKNLSSRFGNKIFFKREDLQSVFSFKLRGAFNRIYQLSKKQNIKGVITSSAGNHAQGVALSCLKLKIPATIVMPLTTPVIKIEAVKALKAKIILIGDSYDEAHLGALKIQKEQNLSFIHPFDDPDTIAGQGTIATEICNQSRENDYIFVPVGGGGLIAGIAVYIKYLYPETKIIGVEPTDANAMLLSLKAKKRVNLDKVGMFADGVAVKKVGAETFKICQQFVDEIITVDTDQMCAAIKDIFNDTRALMEPAGALAVAGAKKYINEHKLKNKKIIVINSGANLNFDRMRHIAERTEIGEQQEILLVVNIPEQVGSFRKFCKIINNHSISEFNYRYAKKTEAQIFVGIKIKATDKNKKRIIDSLQKNNYKTEDITNNEMAKLHIRYMIGGRALNVTDEKIFRFRFPEVAGSLLKFLNFLGKEWNISLFHYRNHGSDFGRVLVGIQVPKIDNIKFKKALDDCGFEFVEETDNIAYKKLLK
ncbi:MAG: threonine ammonia-lyase, biosynthetic [Gammaproteobacteria bacterium]|nr:MAG: threonine ammonia-lyase, biosynthetic [Gammaproteobacteria bacterium]